MMVAMTVTAGRSPRVRSAMNSEWATGAGVRPLPGPQPTSPRDQVCEASIAVPRRLFERLCRVHAKKSSNHPMLAGASPRCGAPGNNRQIAVVILVKGIVARTHRTMTIWAC